jgi:hypothetical protein
LSEDEPDLTYFWAKWLDGSKLDVYFRRKSFELKYYQASNDGLPDGE